MLAWIVLFAKRRREMHSGVRCCAPSLIYKQVNSDMPDNIDDEKLELHEWTDSIQSVISFEGVGRADALLSGTVEAARRRGAQVPFAARSAYVNTLCVEQQPVHPGDEIIERRIHAAIRWNAAAIVLRANKTSSELGGHIASYQSAATLYDTGFEHFWHAPSETHGGDLVLIQGHSSPGIYARAFLEGRLSEEQILNFRQEVAGNGVSSYPHPWLMPDFWQFPTVSMGLGPIMAIYQARFLKYLNAHGLADTTNRHVWAFCGDGEMDEPESLGAISLAGREILDNLIFRRELQPPAARWTGAWQRQDYSGVGGHLPRCRMARHQGHLGLELGWPLGAG